MSDNETSPDPQEDYELEKDHCDELNDEAYNTDWDSDGDGSEKEELFHSNDHIKNVNVIEPSVKKIRLR